MFRSEVWCLYQKEMGVNHKTHGDSLCSTSRSAKCRYLHPTAKKGLVQYIQGPLAGWWSPPLLCAGCLLLVLSPAGQHQTWPLPKGSSTEIRRRICLNSASISILCLLQSRDVFLSTCLPSSDPWPSWKNSQSLWIKIPAISNMWHFQAFVWSHTDEL